MQPLLSQALESGSGWYLTCLFSLTQKFSFHGKDFVVFLSFTSRGQWTLPSRPALGQREELGKWPDTTELCQAGMAPPEGK